MSVWTAVVTNGGNRIFNSWLEGKTLRFGRVAGASGTVPVAALIVQNVLQDEMQDLSFLGGGRVGNGIKLKIQITPPDIGYRLRQIGVWAGVDEETPTLVAIYQNETGILIPSQTENPDFVYTFYGTVAVSNQGNFTITVDTSALASVQMVRDEFDARQKVIATRIRDPGKPDYGLGGGGGTEAVAAENSP